MALVYVGCDPPIDEGRRPCVYVQGMGTSVVPSATDDHPYLPYIRTTEEFGGLVACPWYPIVELLLHQTNAWTFFLHKHLCIPINVLTTLTTNVFILMLLRGVTRLKSPGGWFAVVWACKL